MIITENVLAIESMVYRYSQELETGFNCLCTRHTVIKSCFHCQSLHCQLYKILNVPTSGSCRADGHHACKGWFGKKSCNSGFSSYVASLHLSKQIQTADVWPRSKWAGENKSNFKAVVRNTYTCTCSHCSF